MPLINSATQAAFKKNLGKEIAHGTPPKKAAAIAHAVQRKARAKGRAGMSRQDAQRGY